MLTGDVNPFRTHHVNAVDIAETLRQKAVEALVRALLRCMHTATRRQAGGSALTGLAAAALSCRLQ